MNGISQISFSAEESVSPKKPTSLPEVAKQRELSGTLQAEADAKSKKQISDAKCKELSGHDIFGPPPEIVPRSVAAARTLESKESRDMGEPAPRNVRTSVKVSNVSILLAWKRIYNSLHQVPQIGWEVKQVSLCQDLLIHHVVQLRRLGLVLCYELLKKISFLNRRYLESNEAACQRCFFLPLLLLGARLLQLL